MWTATSEAADCRSVIRCCQLPRAVTMDDRATFATADDVRDSEALATTVVRRGSSSSSTTSANFTIESLMSTVVGRRSPHSMLMSQLVCASSPVVKQPEVTSFVNVQSASPPYSGSSRHSDTSRTSTDRGMPRADRFFGGELSVNVFRCSFACDSCLISQP
jgi:hypothetical protein